MDGNKIREAAKLFLEGIGEDTQREGLIDTPDRIARMVKELFPDDSEGPEEILSRTFEAPSHDPVIEKNITFYSVCEHHLLPFFGTVDIAYIPGDRVVGLSKLARLVEYFARRLQMQERMTAQIADALMEQLSPAGVYVRVEAEHTCMTMRGIKKPGTKTVTVAKRGVDCGLHGEFSR